MSFEPQLDYHESISDEGLRSVLYRLLDLEWATALECSVSYGGRIYATEVAWSEPHGRRPKPDDQIALYCAAKPMLAVQLVRVLWAYGVDPEEAVTLGGRTTTPLELLGHYVGPDPDLILYSLEAPLVRKELAFQAWIGDAQVKHSSGYSLITAAWMWTELMTLTTADEFQYSDVTSLATRFASPVEPVLAPDVQVGPVRLLRDLDVPLRPNLVGDALGIRTASIDPAFGPIVSARQLHQFVADLRIMVPELRRWASVCESNSTEHTLSSSDAASDGTSLSLGFTRGIGSRVDDRFVGSWGQVSRGGSVVYVYAEPMDLAISFWCDGHTQDRELIQKRNDRIIEGVLDCFEV